MKRSFIGAGEEELNPTILEPTAKLLKAEVEIEEEDEELGDIPSPTSSDSAHSAHSAPESFEPISPVLMPQFLEVKCGNLLGRLHTEKFTCPGIREKCVEVDGCASLLTPIEFTIRAEKSKQKDWKGSIKHNGKMLRTLMETRQIDFHMHHIACSYKCHSRNYITKNGGTTPKENYAARVKEAQQRRHSAPATTPQDVISKLQKEILTNPTTRALFSAHCQAENKRRQEEAERKLLQKQEAIKNLFRNDPVSFWRQTNRSQMTAAVLSKISTEFGMIARSLSSGIDDEQSAKKMNDMIEVVGLTDALCRDMCGPFVLPTSNGVLPAAALNPAPSAVQHLLQLSLPSPVLAPLQVPPMPSPLAYAPLREHHPNLQGANPASPMQLLQDSNFSMLSSSEKLEIMIQSMANCRKV